MRHIFVKEFIVEVIKNNNIYFLTGDLGYSAFEDIQNLIPSNFINAGVGENNMIGVASGLALSGKKVFVYSIVPFLIFRCFEQIRNYICHNSLDIKLIGGGGGFSYSNQGISHNTSEDIAIMRTLPNMKIYSPSTKNETIRTFKFLFNDTGPAYVRLGKAPDFDYLSDSIKCKDSEISNGKDILIFYTGNIIEEVIKAKNVVENKGFSVKLVSIISIKPIDVEYIKNQLLQFDLVFTIEENSIIGGLGSAISEIIAELDLNEINYKRIGLSDEIHKEIGSQSYLRKIKGLGFENISNIILNYAKNK